MKIKINNTEYEKIMKRWDEWRKYIADGGGASWPRDEFEGFLYELCELRELAREIANGNFDFEKIIIKSKELIE